MSENALLYKEYLERSDIIRKRILFLKDKRSRTDDTQEATQLDERIHGLREIYSDMLFAARRLRLYI